VLAYGKVTALDQKYAAYLRDAGSVHSEMQLMVEREARKQFYKAHSLPDKPRCVPCPLEGE
jgi:hypothetical protein